jgi:catechol 2,3-dioxygenase-like lactoylglutathione lyase family enzyme
MKIKLDHINLTVKNVSESIAWYSKAFGFQLVEKGVGSYGQPWAIVASNDSMIVMGEFPEKSNADLEPESKFHRINHFGIRVTDQTEWEKIVKENRLKLNYGGVIHYPNSRSWYVEDPSGHEIEVSHTEGGELIFPKM